MSGWVLSSGGACFGPVFLAEVGGQGKISQTLCRLHRLKKTEKQTFNVLLCQNALLSTFLCVYHVFKFVDIH